MTESDRTPADTMNLVTIPQAAELTHANERTLRRWVASDKLASEPDPLNPRARLVRLEDVWALLSVHPMSGQSRTPHRTPADVDRTPTATSGHPRTESGDDRTPVQGPDLAALEELFQLRAQVAELGTAAVEAERLKGELHQAQATTADQRETIARLEAAAGERDWLRERVEQAEKAAEQARVLHQRDQEALRALTAQVEEMKALPDPEPAKRPWWRFGR